MTYKHRAQPTAPQVDGVGEELRFIPIGSHVRAVKWLRHLYCHEFGRSRPLSLHVMGDSGMGKSRILNHYYALHRGRLRDDSGFHPLHVIKIEAPEDGDCRRLCESLIRECWPDFEPPRPFRYVERCAEVLMHSGVRQILIDEAGNLLHAGRVRQQQTLAVLKHFTNLGLTLCIATTENMRNVLAADEQLHSRFRQLQLPRWNESEEFRALLVGIDDQQGLARRSHLDSQKFVRWLLANGCSTTGAVENLVREATRRARARGEDVLTLATLEEAMLDPLPPPPQRVA